MATSKYLIGTISGLPFVTKIYENRDLGSLGEWDRGSGIEQHFRVCYRKYRACYRKFHARNHTQSNIWDRTHIF